jgi:WD40 repeat protein
MRLLQGHRRSIRSVAFVPGEPETLASGGDDRTVRLWNSITGENWTTLRGHGDSVLALAFTADGGLLASGGRDGSLAVWDVALGHREEAVSLHEGPVVAVAFAPNRRTLLAALRSERYPGESGRLVHWDPSRQPPVERLDWSGGVESAAIAPGGWALAIADLNRGVELWEMGTRRRQTSLRCADRVRSLAFSPPGQRLLAVGAGRIVECWDVARVQRCGTCAGHRSEVQALAFAPDGRSLLTGSADRTVRLWDVASGAERAAWDWELGRVHAVAFAPDGMTAAAGGEKADLVVWDLDG